MKHQFTEEALEVIKLTNAEDDAELMEIIKSFDALDAIQDTTMASAKWQAIIEMVQSEQDINKTYRELWEVVSMCVFHILKVEGYITEHTRYKLIKDDHTIQKLLKILKLGELHEILASQDLQKALGLDLTKYVGNDTDDID